MECVCLVGNHLISAGKMRLSVNKMSYAKLRCVGIERIMGNVELGPKTLLKAKASMPIWILLL